MNKSINFTVLMVAVLSVGSAYAIGSRSAVTGKSEGVVSAEAKKKREQEIKAFEAGKKSGDKQADLESRFADLLDGNFGSEVAHILGKKLTNVVNVQGKDGKEVTYEHTVDTNEIAEFLLTKMQTDGKGAMKSELEVAANFTGLAKNLSTSGTQEYGAFVKQVDLIPEMFTTMSAAERATHIAVMAKALSKLKQNSELRGEIALSLALKEMYGKDYAQKMLDILGCLKKG